MELPDKSNLTEPFTPLEAVAYLLKAQQAGSAVKTEAYNYVLRVCFRDKYHKTTDTPATPTQFDEFVDTQQLIMLPLIMFMFMMVVVVVMILMVILMRIMRVMMAMVVVVVMMTTTMNLYIFS
jgi:hypothetical protein